MFKKLCCGLAVALLAASIPQTADAGGRRFVSRRTVNSFQRDVRQFQRQRTRTFNQFDRNLNRSFRGSSSIRYAPRSNSLFIGSRRGGIYFGF